MGCSFPQYSEMLWPIVQRCGQMEDQIYFFEVLLGELDFEGHKFSNVCGTEHLNFYNLG